MNEKITVVMLNYQRVANVERIVRAHLLNDRVACVLIWNNNSQAATPFFGDPRVRIVEARQNWGLFPRYALALLAPTDCVLIQDDDLMLPAETAEKLFTEWNLARLRIHGLYGRLLIDGERYAENRDHDDCLVPIVLGRCMMFRRQLVPVFFDWLEAVVIQNAMKTGAAMGCLPSSCDDIIFSFAGMQISQSGHRIHNLPRVELSADGAISANPKHYEFRQLMTAACLQISNSASAH